MPKTTDSSPQTSLNRRCLLQTDAASGGEVGVAEVRQASCPSHRCVPTISVIVLETITLRGHVALLCNPQAYTGEYSAEI